MDPQKRVFAGRPDDGNFVAPRGYEKQVGGLPFVREYDRDTGLDCYVSRWQPDEGDRATIAAGGSILLRVYGNGHPPVSLMARRAARHGWDRYGPARW